MLKCNPKRWIILGHSGKEFVNFNLRVGKLAVNWGMLDLPLREWINTLYVSGRRGCYSYKHQRRRVPLWQYFEVDNSSEKATCQICGETFTNKREWGTVYVKRHLKRHPEEFVKAEQMRLAWLKEKQLVMWETYGWIAWKLILKKFGNTCDFTDFFSSKF